MEDVLRSERQQGVTWREYIEFSARINGIYAGIIYPVFAFKPSWGNSPVLIGFCFKGLGRVLFFDYEIPENILNFVSTLNEFVDVDFWDTTTECLLYHGVAIVADEKVQMCAREFGWFEAYMAAHRGQFKSFQEWAREPPL